MTTGLLFALIWLTASILFGLLWTAIAAGLRRRHNVIDLSEARELRELDEALRRHPSNCRKVGGRVVIR